MYRVGMKAHWFAAALLAGALTQAQAKTPLPPRRPEPPVRVTVLMPDTADEESKKRLADTQATVARLMGADMKASSIGKEGEHGAKRAWSAPRWSAEVPENERLLVLEGLRRVWGERIAFEPALPERADAPAPSSAPRRPDAREERAAGFAAAGEANTAFAARFAALSDKGAAYDGSADRVTDAVAAAPSARLPDYPVTADGQPPAPDLSPAAAPKPGDKPAPPAPQQAPAPAVGEGAKEHCTPLHGKGSKPRASLDEVLAEEARCTGVNIDVIKALIAAKGSNKYNPLVVTPEAANWVGVRGNLNDPRTSVRAGALLLSKLYTFFKGDLNRALAAYEVGLTSVIRSGGIPNNKSVKDLLAEFQKAYRKDGDKPVSPELPPSSPNARRVDEEVRNVLTGPQLAPRVSFSATEKYRAAILQASRMYGVPAELIEAVILSESEGRSHLTSDAGAQGLMQLMPDTARSLGVKDAYNPTQNINGGTKYLKELIDRFNGNYILAVAAYNAGPNRDSLAAGRVPTIRETVNYVTRVFHRYSQLTGTEMQDVSTRMTATGKRWSERESRRLEQLWGATPEPAPLPPQRPAELQAKLPPQP